MLFTMKHLQMKLFHPQTLKGLNDKFLRKNLVHYNKVFLTILFGSYQGHNITDCIKSVNSKSLALLLTDNYYLSLSVCDLHQFKSKLGPRFLGPNNHFWVTSLLSIFVSAQILNFIDFWVVIRENCIFFVKIIFKDLRHRYLFIACLFCRCATHFEFQKYNEQ